MWHGVSRAVVLLRRPFMAGRIHRGMTGGVVLSRAPWVAVEATGGLPQQPKTARRRGRPRVRDPGKLPAADVQEHLSGYGVDVARAVKRYPALADYSLERVQRTTAFLEGLQVDVGQVIRHQPPVLARSLERMEELITALKENGMNPTEIINCYPAILMRRTERLNSLIDVLSNSNVQWSPRAVRNSFDKDLQSMGQLATPQCQYLMSVGVDPHKVLRRAPHALTSSVDRLKQVVDYLDSLNLATASILNRAPRVLGYRVKRLQEKVTFLRENGLDIMLNLNNCPTVFVLSIDRKLEPMLLFALEDMERTRTEISRYPVFWTRSLKDHIQPRFYYLQSLQQDVGSSFRSLVLATDKAFAVSCAQQNLEHYYSWRRQHGYAVNGCLPHLQKTEG